MNLHLGILIGYSFALMALGAWIGRRVRGAGDFFVAGRQLGPGLIFATMLAAKPKLSLALAKRAVYRSLDQSLPEMLDYELDAQLQCFKSGDAREGIAAFLEKRTATFST